MTTQTPETWDLSAYFPSFDGVEYREFKDKLREDLEVALKAAEALPVVQADSLVAWEVLFGQWEDLDARLGHIDSYLGCLSSADAAHEGYQAETAALSEVSAALSKVTVALRRAFSGASDEDWAAFVAQEVLQGAEHTLNTLRAEGAHLMSAAEENLAADLNVDGLHAWGRMYDTVTGKMSFTLTRPDGSNEKVSMSQRRALLSDGDRSVREAAFTGGNKVWEAAEDSLAAALNAIAGTRLTLYGRRGQSGFLDQPMRDNVVDEETVEAMFGAIAQNYTIPRRILQAGAKLQGTSHLRWYDLEAPRFPAAPKVSWDEGVALCRDAFGRTYPALAAYFDQALESRWVESALRANKRPGAFCTGSDVTREERVYMTFNGTMSDVNTLAHEFGHAWHSHVLGGLRPCARDYPMTLAETASTFAENLLSHGLMADESLNEEQRAFLIDQATNHAPTYLLNIPVRYHFEKRFYEERRAGAVSVSRLRELMVAAQREVYGEVLEEGGEDPWFWASKLHFFITELSFYNFPYTFGYLLSQALYGEFVREGADFLPRYEAFLKLTGSASCEDAVQQALDRDLRDPDFWTRGIEAILPKVDALESLTKG